MDFDYDQIDRIINARSVAIVGASSAPMKFGSFFTRSLMSMSFDGPVYLVNPRETEIMGREVYSGITKLPETPDIAFVTIPASRSMDVLEDCAEMGVRCVIIIASGFRESGPGGERLEKEALDIARRGGFRIIGPNCFGIYNPRNRLTLLPGHDFSTVAGDTAFISQSGGFSAHVARLGKSLGIHFSAVVSYGNAADLDEADFIRYFARDDETRIIAAYLEGSREGRRLVKALEEATGKPVIIWKVGKGDSSRRAVVSHTGSLAGSSEVWDGMFRQYGVIAASGVEELMDIVLAVKHLGVDCGRRMLICGGGGGLGTYGADLAESEGLKVPALPSATRDELESILVSAGAVAANPLDLGAPLIHPDQLRPAVEVAARDPNTDVMVFDLAVNFGYDLAAEKGLDVATDILVEARRQSGKPLVAVLYSRSCDPEEPKFYRILGRLRSRLHESGIPVFPTMQRAIRAVSRINRT